MRARYGLPGLVLTYEVDDDGVELALGHGRRPWAMLVHPGWVGRVRGGEEWRRRHLGCTRNGNATTKRA